MTGSAWTYALARSSGWVRSWTETLQEILDAARSLSPVFDTITKPVAVAATLQKES
jgi:hypothetical protein